MGNAYSPSSPGRTFPKDGYSDIYPLGHSRDHHHAQHLHAISTYTPRIYSLKHLFFINPYIVYWKRPLISSREFIVLILGNSFFIKIELFCIINLLNCLWGLVNQFNRWVSSQLYMALEWRTRAIALFADSGLVRFVIYYH